MGLSLRLISAKESMSPKISIVMPTYNEVENVENLIHRIEETLKKDFEIIEY